MNLAEQIGNVLPEGVTYAKSTATLVVTLDPALFGKLKVRTSRSTFNPQKITFYWDDGKPSDAVIEDRFHARMIQVDESLTSSPAISRSTG